MLTGATRRTLCRSRPRASRPFPHFDVHGDEGLCTTEEVLEQSEETHSSLLGPDGEPLQYKSKKLGHVGFIKLKERP